MALLSSPRAGRRGQAAFGVGRAEDGFLGWRGAGETYVRFSTNGFACVLQREPLAETGMRIGEATAPRVKNLNGSIRVVENAPEVGG
jgi:hypothetical protein